MRRLAAIMFADMVGYTALMQEDERRAKAYRDRARDVLRTEIPARGGEILQFYGDGTLSVFPSAIGAVEAGVAIQRALGREPRVPLRIGIHTGDIVRDDEGVFGDGVNVAARIESLSVPGGILLSDKVYDEVKNQPGIDTVPLGDFDLKNVKRLMKVYAVRGDGLTVPDPRQMSFRAGGAQGSVAVLPFVSMSADPENEYFSDGITEELINLLTRVNGLKVTARTSSFAFKGREKDVREIARELGVATVLEGSVRKAGSRVRITAQLIDARDGYHLFSQSYDRTLDDIFETQDEIASTIVGALEHRLAGGGGQGEGELEASPRPSERPMKPEAHAAYLKGLYFWNKWTPEGSRQAIQCFERAADLDPDAALPHSGLAFVYGQLAAMGQIRPSVGYPRAEAEALRGLELDPNSGEAHTALAMGRLFYRWDFDGAYEHFQKALSLNPGSAIPRHLYSLYLIATGQPRQAIEEMEVAVSLDPLSLAMRDTLGMACLAARDAAGAEATYAAILEMDPSFRAAIEGMGWARFEAGDLEGATEWFARYARAVADPLKGIAPLGVAYAHSGREAEAREILARTEERARRDPDSVLTLEFAALHAALGDRDRAFEFLEQAYDQRLGACLLLTSFSFWDSIREDPRFAAIQQRVGSGA